MAREAIPLGALLIATALAGCVQTLAPIAPAQADASALALTAGPALWEDPQNFPHPAWNWPTLARPATGPHVPAWWVPIPSAIVPSAIDGVEHVAQVPGGIDGAGIAVFGSLVAVPGFGPTSWMVSLADPEHPTLLSSFSPKNSTHRGAAFIAYPTGTLVAVFATPVSLEFWDVTDPTQPTFASDVRPAGGSHKVGVVPGTPIVYNANSDGRGAAIAIYDATDPRHLMLVQDFRGGFGCHHVYFWMTPEKQRGICAGVEETQVLDLADPKHPTVIVSAPVHHGIPGTPSTGVSPARFSHFAILSQDGETLIVGDETGGGVAPGCDAHAQAAGVSLSGPLGDVYFYDVRDETSPKLKGWFNPGTHFLVNRGALTCTAHHGRIVPDPAGARDLLVMAYYGAGVVLIDFTDAGNPMLVDQWAQGTDTWEAWYANGWIVTGDLSRGLDVLKLV